MDEQFDTPGNLVRVPKAYAEKLSPRVHDTLRFTDYQAKVVEKTETEYVLEFDRDTLSSLLPKGHRFTVAAVQPVNATWVVVELREVWVQPVVVLVPVTQGMNHQDILDKAAQMANIGRGEEWEQALTYSHMADPATGDIHIAAESVEARTFVEKVEKHAKRR